jgi:hypothetical protein
VKEEPMEIHLDAQGGATLLDPTNFKAFKVVVHGLSSPSALHEALAVLGLPDEDCQHVFVELEWLQSNAGALAGSDSWNVGLAAMVEAATRYGWVDEAKRIRAHVEHSGE